MHNRYCVIWLSISTLLLNTFCLLLSVCDMGILLCSMPTKHFFFAMESRQRERHRPTDRQRCVSSCGCNGVCVSGADGVVSSLGHQPSVSRNHTSSHTPQLTSALPLELPHLTLTSPKHITQ